MPRVATYYDSDIAGRNDGNPLYITEALKRVPGMEVVHLAPRGDLTPFGEFDFHVEVDWASDALNYPHFEIPHPSIFWASDTHLGYDYRLKRAREFDLVFVAQKDAVAKFAKDGVKAIWLPHAAEPGTKEVPCYEHTDSIKRHDLSFVGHLNDFINDDFGISRVDFLDKIFKEFYTGDADQCFWGIRKFHEAAQVYCETKVNLNFTAKNDINMRNFEVLCCGGFLLTNDLGHNGMWDLFEEGKHFATYKTVDECKEKIRYYLAHPEEADKMAQAGMEHVRQFHTFNNRVAEMLDNILPLVTKEQSHFELNKALDVIHGIALPDEKKAEAVGAV